MGATIEIASNALELHCTSHDYLDSCHINNLIATRSESGHGTQPLSPPIGRIGTPALGTQRAKSFRSRGNRWL